MEKITHVHAPARACVCVCLSEFQNWGFMEVTKMTYIFSRNLCVILSLYNNADNVKVKIEIWLTKAHSPT